MLIHTEELEINENKWLELYVNGNYEELSINFLNILSHFEKKTTLKLIMN